MKCTFKQMKNLSKYENLETEITNKQSSSYQVPSEWFWEAINKYIITPFGHTQECNKLALLGIYYIEYDRKYTEQNCMYQEYTEVHPHSFSSSTVCHSGLSRRPSWQSH